MGYIKISTLKIEGVRKERGFLTLTLGWPVVPDVCSARQGLSLTSANSYGKGKSSTVSLLRKSWYFGISSHLKESFVAA